MRNIKLSRWKNGIMDTYPRIALPSDKGYSLVRASDILYCIADGGHSHLMLTNQKKVLVYKKLKEVEALLGDDHFLRIHHSHVVNLQHIVGFRDEGNVVIELSNGEELPVSRSRKAKFFEKFVRL